MAVLAGWDQLSSPTGTGITGRRQTRGAAGHAWGSSSSNCQGSRTDQLSSKPRQSHFSRTSTKVQLMEFLGLNNVGRCLVAIVLTHSWMLRMWTWTKHSHIMSPMHECCTYLRYQPPDFEFQKVFVNSFSHYRGAFSTFPSQADPCCQSRNIWNSTGWLHYHHMIMAIILN